MTRPERLPAALPLVIALVTGLVLVQPLTAQAGPTKKVFHESLSVLQAGTPVSQPLLAATSYDLRFTLTNDSASLQPFGSAKVLVPTGYTVGALATDVAGFSAAAVPGAILVTSSGSSSTGIDHGQSLRLTVSVTTPSSGSCRATWTTFVKQSNDFSGSGNDFSTPDAAPTTTTGGRHLVFSTQPSLTQWDRAMTPAPVTTVLDPCGATDSSFTGAVTVSDGGRIATGATATAAAGVATFTGLTFNDYGFTDALTASAPGVTSVTSSAFDVVQSLVPCAARTSCTTGTIGDRAGTTLVSITAATGATADVLTATVKGDPSVFGTCGQPAGSNEPPLGAIVTFNVTSRSKTITMRLPRVYVNAVPNNGTPFMDLCLEVPATTPFVDKFGHTVTTGLLPDCTSTRRTTCVSARGKNAGDEVLTAQLPPGDPRGSWY